jgi:hypothetical protein
VICSKCGRENKDDARSCWNCDTPTSASKTQGNNLPGFLKFKRLGRTEVLSGLLYLGAILVIGSYLLRAVNILLILGISTDSIGLPLSYFANGLFYAGIIAGLAGFTYTQRNTAQRQKLSKTLYIAAMFMILIAIPILAFQMFTYTAWDISITTRLSLALTNFAQIVLFQSGFLVGLGALNAPRQQSEPKKHNPMINILYFAAAATLTLGIITASLSVTAINEGFSIIEKISMFLGGFTYYGLFYSCVLVALGKLISLRNRNRNALESIGNKCKGEKEEDADMDGSSAT